MWSWRLEHIYEHYEPDTINVPHRRVPFPPQRPTTASTWRWLHTHTHVILVCCIHNICVCVCVYASAHMSRLRAGRWWQWCIGKRYTYSIVICNNNNYTRHVLLKCNRSTVARDRVWHVRQAWPVLMSFVKPPPAKTYLRLCRI